MNIPAPSSRPEMLKAILKKKTGFHNNPRRDWPKNGVTTERGAENANEKGETDGSDVGA